MSDVSTATVADTSVVIDGRGIWRDMFARIAAPCIALWQRWGSQAPSLAVHELSESELLDMGASPELIAEAQAMREFEHARACALCHYYW